MRRPNSSTLWVLLGIASATLGGFDIIKRVGGPPSRQEQPVATRKQLPSELSSAPDFETIVFLSFPARAEERKNPPTLEVSTAVQRESRRERYVGTIRINGGRSAVYVRRK